MTGLQCIEAAIRIDKNGQVPVVPQIFGHAAVLSGMPVDEYLTSGDALASCQLAALGRYGHHAVFSVMDVCVEAEAMGAKTVHHPNNYPCIEQYVSSEDAINSSRVPNPLKDGRMPEMLKAISIMRRETKEETLVVGCVMGPMTLAMQYVGVQEALFMAVEHPLLFEKLLDHVTDVIIEFGRAQIDAGAHLPIIFDPSSSPEVIPPQFFREIVLQRLKRISSAFKQGGAVANWLHIAGKTLPILPHYPDAGIDMANCDYCIEPAMVRRFLPGICLDGNIKPLSFVEDSSEDIYKESVRLVKSFAGQGGFVLSSGCEIPPESRPENIEAMVKAAKECHF
ncbi:MAG: uroporphyrinogen decarboxylase family protein [Nitrospiraceae bacterium]|nr:uroporphyrinogen decarboxylase family protein [Nitrospiraceae bacterium]